MYSRYLTLTLTLTASTWRFSTNPNPNPNPNPNRDAARVHGGSRRHGGRRALRQQGRHAADPHWARAQNQPQRTRQAAARVRGHARQDDGRGAGTRRGAARAQAAHPAGISRAKPRHGQVCRRRQLGRRLLRAQGACMLPFCCFQSPASALGLGLRKRR